MRLLDKILIALSVLIVIATAFYIYSTFTAPIDTKGDLTSLDISNNPIQTAIDSLHLPPLSYGDATFHFHPRAGYAISGQLVSKRKYTSGFMHNLSPWDYALVWGGAIQQLDRIKFKQVVRFCLFTYNPDKPVDPRFIGEHMSNNHLIPSNKNLRKALALAKKGSKVKLEGYLVDVAAMKGDQYAGEWNTSLVRSDDGNGACEIIYLTKVRIDDRVYQ